MKMEIGENPFQLDSKAPKISLKDYAYNEMRYLMLAKSQPKIAKELITQAQKEVHDKWRVYEQMEQVYEPGKEEKN